MQKLNPILSFLARHKRWLIAASTMPLLGVVAAFGTAPDTETYDIQQETVVESIELPVPVAADSGNFDFWREEAVKRGDSLGSLLNRLGVNSEEVPAIVAASRDAASEMRLVSGRSVLARVTSTGRLMTFRYMVGDDRLVSIDRIQDDFRVKVEPAKLESQMVMRAGEIRSSLFGATDAAGVPDAVASQMAEIFSSDIDFHRDLRQGDRFSLVYETYFHGGATVKTGRLLAAEFTNQGKTYKAVYFRDPQGREGYYTPEGNSMKRAFLKSPIPFSRVSSGFSTARFHPVLKTWRAHKGVDYAAPTGTPVRAIADAVVTFAGRQNGYGNIVILNHRNPYSTAYGHLSRFAKNMRKGARVNQGDVIGYVGMTGVATGPHLHYEFRVAGVQKNPMALKLPSSQPLDNRYRGQFAATVQPLVTRLGLLDGRSIASRD